KTLVQLSEEWLYWMRRRYYPAVAEGRPLAVSAELLARLAIKPAAYRLPGDSSAAVLYFSPSTGYTNIYARSLGSGRSHAVVKGERSPQFESFHFFESRMDVSAAGVVVFGSRYQDRDALFFWSLAKNSVVFSSDRTTFGPEGGRNLFTLDLATGVIRYLTYGRWQDDGPRWSTTTHRVYFSSDRDGIPQIYSVDSSGAGRRETSTLNGAF